MDPSGTVRQWMKQVQATGQEAISQVHLESMDRELPHRDTPPAPTSEIGLGVRADNGSRFDGVLRGNGDAKNVLDYVFFQASEQVGHEQAQGLARIVIAALMTAVLLVRALTLGSDMEYPYISGAYGAASFAYYLFVSHYRDRFLWRRYIAIGADLAIGGYAVYRLGLTGVAFYPIFLWVVIGNGLRFGSHYLRVATAAGLATFLLATLSSGLASSNPFIVLGLFLGLALMPKFFLVMFGRLTDVNNELREQRNQAHLMATHDVLTGLPNRLFLEERLTQAIARAKRTGCTGGIVFLDLDEFKSINDNFGHDYGDLLLKEVAKCLRGSVRASDSVVRFGGDEFIVVIEDTRDPGDVIAAVEQLFRCLRQTVQLGQYQAYVTASCGVALFPQDGDNFVTLIKHADTAMYRAKASGRNGFCLYDEGMSEEIAAQLSIREDLRYGIDHGQLVLHYQPQVDMPSGRVVACEALVRWLHPERGMVSPIEFIPLAEKTGLILPMGNWVLETACTQLASWAGEPEMADISIAVNVSPAQFQDAGFANHVRTVIQRTGANPGLLKLELTESILLSDVDDVIAKMNTLKGLGVGFSLDDFGTGYSSLSHLSRLPLDQLKIDRSFVMKIETGDSDAVICAATISLAHSLKLTVVAEGVETDAQRYFLAAVHRCDFIQGYLFSRPLAVADFEAFVGQKSAV
jgi:diguanylate cyclase (GGDEF)-like protein